MKYRRITLAAGLCVLATGLPSGVTNGGAWALSSLRLSKPALTRKQLSKEALEKRAFCSAPGPGDYAQPLAKLPAINELPYEKQRLAYLPFGPKRLAFYSTHFSSPVLVNGGSYGYALFNEAYNDPPTLNWTISAQLHSLNGFGEPKDTVDQDSIEVKKVNDAYPSSVKLEVPNRVGFYRVDIQFATMSGEMLGEYSEYLRVVRPTIHVRLGITKHHVRHGQLLAFRIENVGTAQVTYGYDYWVARATPRGWEGVDRLNEREMLAYFGIVEAGQAGRCNSFRVPSSLPKGLYRVSKGAGVTKDWKTFKGINPSAEFRVTDPPRG
jgi:hypothetical protein